jgi:hypothetical protein
MDNIPMIANANRRCRNVGSIVAIASSRSSDASCSLKLFSQVTAFRLYTRVINKTHSILIWVKPAFVAELFVAELDVTGVSHRGGAPLPSS